jgi:hypothetical protein
VAGHDREETARHLPMKSCFVHIGKSAYRMGSEHMPATAARWCGQSAFAVTGDSGSALSLKKVRKKGREGFCSK